MTSLTDIIAAASSQIKNSTATSSNQVSSTLTGAFKGTASGVAGIPAALVQAQVSKATVGVNQAVNVGMTDVRGAASLAMQGNFSGAVAKLGNTATDVLGSLASSFGLSKGSSLKGPGLTDSGTPGNSLAGALARSDPLLSFNWYAILPDIAPMGGSVQTLPWYYIEEATPPFRTFTLRSIFREGRERHYPSKYSVDSLRLAVYMDTAGVALNYLQAWNGAILYPTDSTNQYIAGGGYGRAVNYKKTIKIHLINVAKKELAILEYVECWPMSIDAYSLDSGTSTRVLNHVTFSVGDVFITLYDISKTAALGFIPTSTASPNTTDSGLVSMTGSVLASVDQPTVPAGFSSSALG